MKWNCYSIFLVFCLCCFARTLYGQQDTVGLKIRSNTVRTERDSVGDDPGLQLLGEVVIRKRCAVRMDKDTTFLVADSIVARQFDNLAELMNRIPGIQVTKDKGILYNGLPIRQIGMDGVAFSNLDPVQLLQLLRGRDVDQLKIYNLETSPDHPGRSRDRQEKGLDIRLKEEAKRGYSGKLAAGTGGGARAQWDQAVDVSSFTDKRKIAVYGSSGNTSGQSAFAASQLPEQGRSSLPRGTAVTNVAGFFYDQKINDRLSVNGHYSMNHNLQNVVQQTTERSFLPSGNISMATQAHSGGKSLSNSTTIQAACILDSFSSVSLLVMAGLNTSGGSGDTRSTTHNADTMRISSSLLKNAYTTASPNAALVLSYYKRFRRAGTLTCSFAPNRSSSKSRAEQYANLDLAGSGQVQEFTQQKYTAESNNIYAISADYKYPLSGHVGIGLNWQSGWTLSDSRQETYDRYRNADNKLFDTLNPLYSNRYALRKASHVLGAMLSFSGKKYTIRLGADLQHNAWKQQDIKLATPVERNFTNMVPSASARMSISKQSVVHIGYQLQVTQPALSQIQPLVNNNDPMNIMVGNPLLTPSFAHNTNAGYTFIAVDGRQALHTGGSLSVIRKTISLRQLVDENGRHTSRYYNQNGNYNSNVSLDYDQSFGKKIKLSAGSAGAFSKAVAIINNEENSSSSQLYNTRFSLRYNRDTVLSIHFGVVASQVFTRISLNGAARSRVVNYGGVLQVNYSLPFGGVSIATSCSWNNSTGSIGNSAGFLIWNAALQRVMNKTQSLTVKLYAYDLLNRNKGFLAYNEFECAA